MLTVITNYLAANLGLRIGSTVFQHYGVPGAAIAAGAAMIWFSIRKPQKLPDSGHRPSGSANALDRARRALSAWHGADPEGAAASPAQPRPDDPRPKTANQLHQEADAALSRALRSTDAADGAAWLRMASETRNAAERAQASGNALVASGPSAHDRGAA